MNEKELVFSVDVNWNIFAVRLEEFNKAGQIPEVERARVSAIASNPWRYLLSRPIHRRRNSRMMMVHPWFRGQP